MLSSDDMKKVIELPQGNFIEFMPLKIGLVNLYLISRYHQIIPYDFAVVEFDGKFCSLIHLKAYTHISFGTMWCRKLYKDVITG